MDTYKSFADSLSTRCKNGLVGCFGDGDIINQPERIAAGRDKLKLARSIGPKSLKEIAWALFEFRYIDNPEMWLEIINLNCPSTGIDSQICQ